MSDVLFKKVDYTLKKLVEDIDMGEIGLPDRSARHPAAFCLANEQGA